MKSAKVVTESGHSWVTSVNGKLSNEEIIKYFLGKYFNVGSYPVEKMEKVVSVVVD